MSDRQVRTGRSSLIWVGVSLIVAFLALLACALAVSLGVWATRASLAEVGPPETPTLVPVPPTIAPGEAQPPEVGVEPFSSAPGISGLPTDIPLPENVDPQSFVGKANQYSFLTDLSYEQVRSFYLTQLPYQGWDKIDYGTRIGKTSAELHYRKDDRILTVRIVDMLFMGRLIEISLQA